MKVIVTVPFDGITDQHTETVEGDQLFIEVDPDTGALIVSDNGPSVAIYASGRWCSAHREEAAAEIPQDLNNEAGLRDDDDPLLPF